jgi:hypothetical protein
MDWKYEDDIKAELRELTSELRRLRQELSGMIAPEKPKSPRAFLHKHAWPPDRPHGVVNDRRKRKSRKP